MDAMMPLQLTVCPDRECQLLAEIVDRFVLASTDGPVEHARVECLGRHIFTVPVSRLVRAETVRS
jgi:hypothetical protein